MIIDNIIHKEFLIVKGLSFIKPHVKNVKIRVPMAKEINLADHKESIYFTAHPQ